MSVIADTDPPVIKTKLEFFRSVRKTYPFEIIRKKISPANFSASNQPILVFLSCPEVSENRQKLKRNYMAADGHKMDQNRKLWACPI